MNVAGERSISRACMKHMCLQLSHQRGHSVHGLLSRGRILLVVGIGTVGHLWNIGGHNHGIIIIELTTVAMISTG